MKHLKLMAVLACVMMLVVSSCKKSSNKKTTCSSTLYGYSGYYLGFSISSFGPINLATHASLSSTATFSGKTYTNHATYNTSDHCYYFFKDGEGSSSLYKMSLSGTLTTYTGTSATVIRYDGIIYNPVTNKLYAVKAQTANTAIVELALSGTAFSEVILAPTMVGEYWASPASTAVDNATGVIYYAVRDATSNAYSIEKYIPGGTSVTTLASGTNSGILGLQFNSNDNMLYAIIEGSAPQEFIKIDPSSGTVTPIVAILFPVNNENYSSVIDACSNRYMVTSTPDSVCALEQMSMTGTLLQSDTVSGVYQGMAEVY